MSDQPKIRPEWIPEAYRNGNALKPIADKASPKVTENKLKRIIKKGRTGKTV